MKNDLEVKPLSTASIIPLLNEFHVKDGDLEEKVVDLGVDEVYIYISQFFHHFLCMRMMHNFFYNFFFSFFPFYKKKNKKKMKSKLKQLKLNLYHPLFQ